jgi:hypothetical protein
LNFGLRPLVTPKLRALPRDKERVSAESHRHSAQQAAQPQSHPRKIYRMKKFVMFLPFQSGKSEGAKYPLIAPRR